MPKSATSIAKKLLAGEPGGLEELRIHEFEDDYEAHDDELTEQLYQEFSAEFDRVVTALSKKYGKPQRTGKKEDKIIPLNGVFRFAIWSVDDQQLYVAAAHEDCGVPIILMIGTAED
jgi:hypothetical protein